ncbi:2Fe-2S iron-sulfur cluster-binding protein [Saccharopolyspora taberi]|uniref:FAD/NAD(P)-binding domain-containing protein n=1 Tax=Saccharopolyspora taberi TaxID=60895 RepID=A0ABN3UZW0_9PSEU
MRRLHSGGRIDRTRPLRFSFDGAELLGYQGDTLASALLANGRIEVGASIHRGRPRGILTADGTEPNAVVRVLGAGQEPMLPATEVELCEGLAAESLSGAGRLGGEVHDETYVDADVLVVGAGPAGLAAALAAGRSGARVVLVDQGRELGGALLDGAEQIDGRPATAWISRAVREFVETTELRVLTRATAVSCSDRNHVLIAQRRGSGSRLWHVRAQRVVLATGAQERPMVFADNDRPGIMLASAVRRYLKRHAVLPGNEIVVATTSDSAYLTALDLMAADARVHAVVDTRPQPPEHLAARVRAAGAHVYAGAAVVGTTGERRVASVRVAEIDDGSITGDVREIACDLLAVSGGWNPAVQLHCQSGGSLRWDGIVAGFVPEDGPAKVIGAARGTYDLAGCLAQGLAAGAAAATASGFRVAAPPVPPVSGDRTPARPRPLWITPGESGDPSQWHDHFVDLQRDFTVADVWRTIGAGAVEQVKHCTTIGNPLGSTVDVSAQEEFRAS